MKPSIWRVEYNTKHDTAYNTKYNAGCSARYDTGYDTSEDTIQVDRLDNRWHHAWFSLGKQSAFLRAYGQQNEHKYLYGNMLLPYLKTIPVTKLD